MTLKDDIKTTVELALGTPGTIHVVRAAPGQGKTWSTIQALADLIASGRVRRVLWAVRETRETTSLGQEATECLTAMGLNARLIRSKADTRLRTHSTSRTSHAAAKATSKAKYDAQFVWAEPHEVKVISHTHLALIYGKDARFRGEKQLSLLRKAELLVVDEDPSDVFLLNEGVIQQGQNKGARRNLRLNALFFENRTDPVSLTLSTLLAQAASGVLDEQAEVSGQPGKRIYSLTGAPFWQTLSHLLPPDVDWKVFAKTMGQTAYFEYKSGISPWVISQMRRALQQFQAGQTPSAQYGLTWPEKREGLAALDVQFRFDVSQYRPLPCSVVVLDAYAHPLHYSAVFVPSPIQIHKVGNDPELKVTVVPGRGRNRQDVAAGKRPEHVLALMEEVVEYARTHGNTLLLCYKNSKPTYQAALDKALKLSPLPPGVNIECHHWRAGRGSNKWEGWNVIALEEFSFPTEYARHSLTALIPNATEAGKQERNQLSRMHSASETLQMWYRSRQTLAAERGWSRTPDVITLYEPDVPGLEALGRIGTVTETDVLKKPDKRTTRPRFPVVVAKCSAELEAVLGAVPLVTFTVLGLEERTEPILPATRKHLQAKLHQLVDASAEPLPLLRGWRATGELPGYEQVGQKRRNSRQELVQILQGADALLLEVRGIRPTHTPAGIRRVAGTVLAASEAMAQQAINLLFSAL